jgi:hypothetical protein
MFSGKGKISLGILAGAVLAAATLVAPGARAQNPPAGAIYDLATSHPGAVSSSYSLFTTSFVADNSTMDVSFAFREVPNYWAFDDASVVNATTGSTTNLLSDPGFESATFGENCGFQGDGTACPPGWQGWIQPIDVSAIGLVATTGDEYGCGADGPHSGTNFWCDGSVQGYDAIYQTLTGLTVGDTYDISWYLAHDDGGAPSAPGIDMLVYAGDNIPIGTVGIGATPEPGTLVLFGSGMLSLAGLLRRKLGGK